MIYSVAGGCVMKKIFMLITCAAFLNLFGACGAQKEVPQMTKDFVILNSGYNMPRLGLGTWTLNDSSAEACVYHALKVGYRLIDTARYYGNEVGVVAEFGGLSMTASPPAKKFSSRRRLCPATTIHQTPPLTIPLTRSAWTIST